MFRLDSHGLLKALSVIWEYLIQVFFSQIQAMDFFSPSQALSTFILFPFHMQLTEGANQVSTSQLCLLIIVITGIMDWLFDVRAVFERDIKSVCRCESISSPK